MSALYAVIVGQPVIWHVVAFADGWPQLVPVGRWAVEFGDEVARDLEWQAVPVHGGQVSMPKWGDEVIYAPDVTTLISVIEPWARAETGRGD